MKEIFQSLLPLIALLSILMRSKHGRKFHFLFPVQVALMIMSIGVSYHWFTTEKEFLYNYGSLWKIVERGTLEAFSSVMGTIGMSCLFFGWTYSEREKNTLGQKQIDIVRYVFGQGYGLSVIIHFVVTVLCWILLKCKAREATLWAFATVIWGCIPQALIFLRIVVNRENREKKALKLWEHEAKDAKDAKKKFLVFRRMARNLSVSDIHSNVGYCNTMSQVIAAWLLACFVADEDNHGITDANIKHCSAIFNEIAERLPKEERAFFEEDILKLTCETLSKEEGKAKEMAIALLCAGYIGYLIAQSPSEMKHRIRRVTYYSKHENSFYHQFGYMLAAFHCGLEWYQFLTQRMGVPQNARIGQLENADMGIAFEALIYSVYNDDGKNGNVENSSDKNGNADNRIDESGNVENSSDESGNAENSSAENSNEQNTLNLAQIAWAQVYLGGEQT